MDIVLIIHCCVINESKTSHVKTCVTHIISEGKKFWCGLRGIFLSHNLLWDFAKIPTKLAVHLKAYHEPVNEGSVSNTEISNPHWLMIEAEALKSRLLHRTAWLIPGPVGLLSSAWRERERKRQRTYSLNVLCLTPIFHLLEDHR